MSCCRQNRPLTAWGLIQLEACCFWWSSEIQVVLVYRSWSCIKWSSYVPWLWSPSSWTWCTKLEATSVQLLVVRCARSARQDLKLRVRIRTASGNGLTVPVTIMIVLSNTHTQAGKNHNPNGVLELNTTRKEVLVETITSMTRTPSRYNLTRTRKFVFLLSNVLKKLTVIFRIPSSFFLQCRWHSRLLLVVCMVHLHIRCKFPIVYTA